MTREELIELANNNPERLALIFAREVAGIKNARLDKKGRLVQMMGFLPDYLTDWTATINAIEKARIEWDKDADFFRVTDMYSVPMRTNSVYQHDNWKSCCALMICAILAKQNETNTKK